MQDKIKNLNDNEFWSKYYKGQKNFIEIYSSYSHYKNIINDIISPKDKILINANGLSKFPFEMLEYEFKDIKVIDKNKDVIKFLNDKNKTKIIKFEEINIYELEDDKFDCIIDKGFVDLLLSSEDGIRNFENLLIKFQKLIKNKGKILLISIFPEIIKKVIFLSNKLNFKKLKIYQININCNIECKMNYLIKIINN